MNTNIPTCEGLASGEKLVFWFSYPPPLPRLIVSTILNYKIRRPNNFVVRVSVRASKMGFDFEDEMSFFVLVSSLPS